MPDEIAKKIEAEFSKHPKKSYQKGQIIIFGGEEPEGVLYLASGRVRQYDISAHGDEMVVNVYKPPSFFPMSWAINQTPNSYFFKTETSCLVHIVPADDAVNFLKANPDVTLDLLARVYRGLDGVLGRIVNLMSASASNRILYELLIDARRFGKPQPNGKVHLSLNESDVAARAGLTRETVSREIHKLKAEKLVSITGNKIVLHNIAAIEQRLHL